MTLNGRGLAEFTPKRLQLHQSIAEFVSTLGEKALYEYEYILSPMSTHSLVFSQLLHCYYKNIAPFTIHGLFH